MKIFVYEFLTGGGLPHELAGDLAALLPEGQAMVCALAADFAALPGVEVTLLRDRRLPPLQAAEGVREVCVASGEEERQAFRELAAGSAWTVLIAPETGGILHERAEWVLAAGGRLLSPDPAFIALTTNKHETACRLAEQGVPVPPGQLVTAAALPASDELGLPWRCDGPFPWGLEHRGHCGPESAPEHRHRFPTSDEVAPGRRCEEAQGPWPVVVKPVDGCGSQEVRLVRDAVAWKALGPRLAARGGRWRVERWIKGLAASVAVVCGPGGQCALPACAQHLADDGSFAYRGGHTPLPAACDARARRLALRAVAALPATCGYVGVDVVLGADPAGRDDHVIEVNPRLTTSYLGLRRALEANLAEAMLRLATGQPWAWSGRPSAVQFTAHGHVRLAADAAWA
jgi:predicted ATP-grasp superfamily ATP-dependent carboligase